MPRAKTAKNGNSSSKSVATAAGVAVAPGNNHSTPSNREVEIRVRAYELYLERGGEPGHEDDDWRVAEQEIVARHQNA